MIKRVASCPYCRKGEVAFDCDAMNPVFNPDGANQQACEHLICLDGFFTCASVLPDGTTKVACANVHWQHPALPTTPPEEVFQRLQKHAAAGADDRLPPGEQPCQVVPVRWAVEESLSGPEAIRWFEEVGWEKVQGREMPYLEAQLKVWVGFAHKPAELLPALEQAPNAPAG
jgi:hypothetical protein